MIRLEVTGWPRWWRWVFLLSLVVVAGGALLLVSCGQSYGTFKSTHRPQAAARLDPKSCQECHQQEVLDWQRSHHAVANRLVSFSVDSAPFQLRQTVDLGSRKVTTGIKGERLLFTEDGESGIRVAHPVGVIGVDPLWQHIIPIGRGRFQAYSVTYEPSTKEWFYVFDRDVREPGEWGHWKGQGMNWNANCAYCHMTDYHKNLNDRPEPEISYQSEWLHQGITCAQCHNDLEQHVADPEAPYQGIGAELTREQIEHSCATCHSRREELTPEAFRPGDRFHDHYRLTLVNEGDIYHPDGQVNNENFVYTSMRLNRMGHAGITCLDCHQPHSGELVLPAENNALCLKCHADGSEGASVIDPIQHSKHQPGSSGSVCIECHMPVNYFMARDDRRDHIFYSPDPALSKELGSPDTCTACHTDQDLDWAAEWTDRWWPRESGDRNRRRARAIQEYRTGESSDYRELLDLAKTEEIAAWRASLVGMLIPWVQWGEVREFVRECLEDPSPLVRTEAAVVLGAHPQATMLLGPVHQDPVRSVRLQASRLVGPTAANREEYEIYLRTNSDRPSAALTLAERSSGDAATMAMWIERAISLESSNPIIFTDASVLLARTGNLEASREMLLRGLRAAPQSPEIHYSLGLVEAELKNLPAARSYLERSVELNPNQPRAWRNLSIIYQQAGMIEAAQQAAQRASQGENR